MGLFLDNMKKEEKKKRNNQEYDTSINIIGGIKDVDVIFNSIYSFFDDDDSEDNIILIKNEFNLRTEKSKIRVRNGIRQAFLHFKSKKHQLFLQSIINSKIPRSDIRFILFWQYAINNRLFREISINVFLKLYFSGRVGITKDDLIGYMKDFIKDSNKINLDWSESTINTMATKYLNFMTKLNFVVGSRIKKFNHIKISNELTVLFLYFSKIHHPGNNLLKNDHTILSFTPLSFLHKSDIVEHLKKISGKGYFDMTFNGKSLYFELQHGYEEIPSVLYNRS